MPTETLTSRERVLRTLNREPVDRLPLDLGMHPSTGISAFAYWHLREHLGLGTSDIWMHDLVQLLAAVDEDIRTRFHIDTIMLEPRWAAMGSWQPRRPHRFGVAAAYEPHQEPDGSWVVRQGSHEMRMPADAYYFDGDWLSNWGGLPEDAALDLYAREAERIYKETPYATAFLGYSHGGGCESYFHGFDQAIQMMEEPDAVHAANEAALQRSLARAGKAIDRFGQYIQMICIGNDMGMQSGPMCRPSMMDEFVFPYYKRFCDFVHRNSDLKVFLHNCGSIRAYLPAIIDAGIDVLNPVQITAADMDPAGLKRDFGDKLIFWGGGCDTQNVLGAGSPQQVRDDVRRLMGIFKPGGGFVFNQVHNVMANVPPQNVVAMLETAYELSWCAADD